jgi:TonB-dependent starch-binding outer membrane protein SusC
MQKTVYGNRSACRRHRTLRKTLLVMKLAMILLTAFLVEASAEGRAQNVSYNGTNVSLEKVFSDVEKQTGFYFLYTKQTLTGTRPVSISVKDMPLRNFLDKVFEDQPLAYTIASKTIIISPAGRPPANNTEQRKERGVFATISGIVMEQSGAPVGGASIAIKGTRRGTSAASDGRFTLPGIADDAVIVVSAISFSPVTLKIINNSVTVINEKGQTIEQLSNGSLENINIILTRSTSPLDQTVIVAYGTTTKRLNTGNVSTVKGEEIERQPVITVQQALQGRVPGLDITMPGGRAASPVKMEIRGRNSLNPNALSDPLYIVDGVPVNILNVSPIPLPLQLSGGGSNGMVQAGMPNTYGENILSFINPKDIESVEVLKDADATAIYGSRGSNGVILITTKKAKPGPTRFNISLSQATLTLPRKMPLLNTHEYLAVRREAFQNDGIVPNTFNATDLLTWDSTRYTDWQKELYGTGKQTQLQVGVSGGLLLTTYNITAGYRSQKDLMDNRGKTEAASVNMSLNHRSANQKFTMAISSLLSISNVEAYNNGGSIYLPPNAPPIYDKQGELNWDEWRAGPINRYPFEGSKKPSESKTHTIRNNLSMSYELLDGLTLSASTGYNFAHNANGTFQPTTSFDPTTAPVAQALFGTTTNTDWMVEPQLNYIHYWRKGTLNVLVGGSLQTVTTKGTMWYGMGFPDDNLIRNINNAMIRDINERYAEYKYTAGFGRIKYNWDNKYLINLNVRRDGSSRFGPGKQFGNFGSAGVAWIASQENWLKKIIPGWISFLKLRASYGATGSDAIGDYQYLSRWTTNANDWGTRIAPYGNVNSLWIMQPINQQYQWESAKQLETALEMSLLKDRVNITAAYYRKRSGNQLARIPIPAYTGFQNVAANWDAFVQNAGFEFTANAKMVNQKDFFVSAHFNLSINRNKLLKYPGIEKSPYATLYKVGESLSTGYYMHYTGIDPMTGLHTFEDRNKDGNITYLNDFVPGDPGTDRYVALDMAPKYFGGFGFQVSYKQFDLHLLFAYKKQLGYNPLTRLKPGSMSNMILPDEVRDNRWRKAGDKALYARYSTNMVTPIEFSDGGFTDASYVKLNNVALNYELPRRLIEKARMQSMHVSVSVQNLFYITAYKGFNPELQQLDSGLPLARTISAGLNFNF